MVDQAAKPTTVELSDNSERLPRQVRDLARRERELATAIYIGGSATAKEIEARLGLQLTNGAVRSMLNRLVDKGILKRRPSGRGKALVYVAALTNDCVRERALRQLAQDHFDGSMLRAAATMVDLARSEVDAVQWAAGAIMPRQQSHLAA